MISTTLISSKPLNFGYTNNINLYSIINDGGNGVDVDDSSESNGNDVDDRSGSAKRRKLTDEERLKRCRERNKIHARHTREKKKLLYDDLLKKVTSLCDEKIRLINEKSEKSIANILMVLSGNPSDGSANNLDVVDNRVVATKVNSGSISNAREETMKILGRIRSQVSTLLVEESDFDNSPKLPRERSLCSATELEKLRRERNRLHAKKTRLRKKKMLSELEAFAATLHYEINILKQEKDDHNNAANNTTANDYSANTDVNIDVNSICVESSTDVTIEDL